MEKILFIVLLIISLFALSCNNNSSSSIGKIGEIVVDPNGVTPLSAVYRTETVNSVPITVTVKGLYGEPDIIHTYPSGYGTEFEIHGMFPESDNVIEVNDGGRIIIKNVSIGTLLCNGTTLPKKYDIVINNLPEKIYFNNPELYFTSLATPQWVACGVAGISKNGYVRYFQNYYQSSKLVIENKKIVLYTESSMKNVDLLGNKIMDYPTATHHDVIKVNNNYIYLSLSIWGYEDRLVEMSSSGIKLRELSFGKLIQNSLDLKTYPEDEAVFKQIVFGEDVDNIYKDNNGEQKSIDWFHANSLVYDSSNDTLYVSSRNRGVIAIDYSEWELIWWMADETLSTRVPTYIPYNVHFKDLQSLDAYRVKDSGMNDGPKNQHALFLLANGNLGMFDNQGDEDSNPNGSRYVEYEITGSYGNWKAKKVDEYKYKDQTLYSQIMSDVDFTGKDHQNLLICYAFPTARILELEKNSEKKLFRLDLSFQTYRVDKMPLYYEEGRVYSEDCNLKNPN